MEGGTKQGTDDSKIVIKFKVRMSNIKLGETVRVVGSHPALGRWDVSKSLPLSTDPESFPFWTGEIRIKRPRKGIEYKYIKMNAKNRLKSWESIPFNRTMTIPETGSVFVLNEVYGEAQRMDLYKDRWIDSEWLHGDKVCIVVKTGSYGKDLDRADGIFVYGHHEGLKLKLTGIQMRSQEDASRVLRMKPIGKTGFWKKAVDKKETVKTMTMDFKFKGSDMKAYRAHYNLNSLNYDTVTRTDKLDLFLVIVDNENCYPVGDVRVNIFVVLPENQIKENTIRNNFRQYWRPKTEKTLIGHRGSGSGKSGSILQENSILSFNTVYSMGIKYIEFDVQLTKDEEVVINHDLTVPLKLPGGDEIRVPVRDLTKEQFLRLNERRRKNELEKSYHFDDGDRSENIRQIVDQNTTLSKVFSKSDPGLSFNIEIKYPESKKEIDDLNYFDRNRVVDKVLEVVFSNMKRSKNKIRRILFSSFDPMICYMIQKKQVTYPVLLLTNDNLTRSIHFAESNKFLGVVSNASLVFQFREAPKICEDKGLLLFTYGAENNDKKLVEEQLEMGVVGIISDKVAKMELL